MHGTVSLVFQSSSTRVPPEGRSGFVEERLRQPREDRSGVQELEAGAPRVCDDCHSCCSARRSLERTDSHYVRASPGSTG